MRHHRRVVAGIVAAVIALLGLVERLAEAQQPPKCRPVAHQNDESRLHHDRRGRGRLRRPPEDRDAAGPAAPHFEALTLLLRLTRTYVAETGGEP